MTSEPFNKPRQPKEADAPILTIMVMFAVLLLVVGFMTSPSKRHPNHQNAKPAEYSQEAPSDVPKSKAPVDAVSKSEKENQDDNHLKEANLKIQWAMADIAWMGLFIGFMGIVFIIWTLKETQAAGNLVAQQNKNAMKATAAEFQPYILFEQSGEIGYKNGYFNRRDARQYPHSIEFPVIISFSNIGKTPALDVFWRMHGCIRNNIFSQYPKFSCDVANIKGNGWSKKYILEKTPIEIKATIGVQVDEDAALNILAEKSEITLHHKDVSLETCEIRLFCRVSFKDSFIESDEIRVVSAEFRFNKDRTGLSLYDFEEVAPDAEDYEIRNQKQPKHQPAPEA